MPSPVLARRLITPFRSKLLAEYAVNGYFGGITTSRATAFDPGLPDADGELVSYSAGEVAIYEGDSVFCSPPVDHLVDYSMDATQWTTVSGATQTDTGQTLSGFKKVEIESGGSVFSRRRFLNNLAVSDGDVVAVTVYVQAGTSGAVRVVYADQDNVANSIVVGDIGSVAVGSEAAGAISEFDETNLTWGGETVTRIRFKVTHSAGASTDVTIEVGPNSATVGENVVALGADAVKEDFFPPLEKSTGSPVSTDATEPKYTEISDLTNNLAGRLYWTPLADDQGTVWILGNYTDANNAWGILHDGTNLIFRNRVSGTNNDATIALNYVTDTEYRIDYRLAKNGLDIAVDGTKGTTDSTTTDLTNATNTYYGQDGNGASHCFCAIREHTEKRIASNFSDAEWLA